MAVSEWQYVQDSCIEEPAEIDMISSAAVVYERRNVKQEAVKTNEPDSDTEALIWSYEQREWPREEYLQMQQELESPVTRAIMQSISNLELQIAMQGLEV
ncbi:MAG: hypothetical protein IJD56_01665 [Peptococcaceae bacterium]|nr:hypothetical protein [Peptococcaceae bacterium]